MKNITYTGNIYFFSISVKIYSMRMGSKVRLGNPAYVNSCTNLFFPNNKMLL